MVFYVHQAITVSLWVLTKAVEVVIFVPPEAPTTILTSPSGETIIVGHIEDKGRFHGAIKLAGEAGTPK